MATQVSCKDLKILYNLKDYLFTVESQTQYSTAALEECKDEICRAIWGETNPDISGIGAS